MVDWFELAVAQKPRFMSKVDVSSGCWLWTSGTDKDGYGKFQVGNVHGAEPKQLHVRAHKMMLSFERGELLAPGVVVRHTCDNPLCVRPDHLIAGTQTENRQDCVDKKRHALGEKHWAVKMSAESVAEIKANPPTRRGDLTRLARKLGVSASAVLDVVKGRTWRTMPAQLPGESRQDYQTPKNLIDAIKKKFGIAAFAYDLAAAQENTQARFFFSKEEDSLVQDWTQLRGDLWLNPEFAKIGPWAQKCAATSAEWDKRPGFVAARNVCRLFFLVPAAVGANWFRDFVDGKAAVYFLNGRPSFDGKGGFPKDLILAVYGLKPIYQVWNWRTK